LAASRYRTSVSPGIGFSLLYFISGFFSGFFFGEHLFFNLEVLIYEGTLTHDEVSAMENKIEVEIEEAFLFAKESPLADQQDLHNHLFCE